MSFILNSDDALLHRFYCVRFNMQRSSWKKTFLARSKKFFS